jgi:competence protein ComEC
MLFYDHSLEIVMETHPDADHIGGLSLVVDRYQVGRFIEPGVYSSTTVDSLLIQDIEKRGVQHIIARRGMVINLGGGAKLSILFPDRNMAAAETNEASIVAKLQYGTTSFLFTGDSPQDIEDYLISLDSSKLQSTVLKVGHHGSKFSTSPEYAAAVHPQFAVISVGIKNTYGHPSPEAIAHLNAVGAEIDMTENEGTIVYKSDGTTVTKE